VAAPRCRNCGGDEFHAEPGTDDHGRCVACREFPTLGFLVGEWIEANCAIPDGDLGGDPYVLTDEMWRFLLRHYRIDPFVKRDSRSRGWALPFVYVRGSQLVRPQKWGKGPFAASIICAEAAPDGPVRFDGWSAAGQVLGRPWATPYIQVTAASEDQADNVWGALLPMIERGAVAADITDTGLTRIHLPSGGKIEPVTSSALSRLGQRVTLVVQDQTESWTKPNGLRELADTQRRGVAGMGGRWLSTANKWDPSKDSVAQYTAEEELAAVYHDDVDPGPGSIANKRELRRMLRRVYGDSWWVNLDRIEAEVEALRKRDPAQAERFYLNREAAGKGKAFDKAAWNELGRDPRPIPDGALVGLGVHGARFQDALAVRATVIGCRQCEHCATDAWERCEMHGYQWTVVIRERPEDAPDSYEHPADEIDDAVAEAFERFSVWRAYVAAFWINHLLEKWQGRWGDKRVIPWPSNRPQRMAWAVRNFSDAVGAGAVPHDGDNVCAGHIGNAHKQEVNVLDEDNKKMHVLEKDRPDSPRSINAASASVLSWECRGDAVAAGAEPPDERKFDPADYRIETL
jgi:hypothetical protein